jgi:hypothetical protein
MSDDTHRRCRYDDCPEGWPVTISEEEEEKLIAASGTRSPTAHGATGLIPDEAAVTCETCREWMGLDAED